MAKINVLIADGRKLLREGVAALLKHTDVRIVGEAVSVEAAAKLIGPLAVDVVLLNVYQLGRSSAEAVRALRSASAQIPIIILAINVTATGVKEVLSAGAAGCLTKECGSTDLISAIRSAIAGKRYVCAEVTNMMIDGQFESKSKLATREQEILCRIASGQNVKEIAFDLQIGPKTVETYRRRLMTKLDRYSVAELTHYAVSEGLISLKSAR